MTIIRCADSSWRSKSSRVKISAALSSKVVASTTAITPSSSNPVWFRTVCVNPKGSDNPLVSIMIAAGGFDLVRISAKRSDKSDPNTQQAQPFSNSMVSASRRRIIAPSMLIEAMSFTITKISSLTCSSNLHSKVVLPAPKKPHNKITGIDRASAF